MYKYNSQHIKICGCNDFRRIIGYYLFIKNMTTEINDLRNSLEKLSNSNDMMTSSLADKGIQYSSRFKKNKKYDIMKFYLNLASDTYSDTKFRTNILVNNNISKPELYGYTIVKSDTIKCEEIHDVDILITNRMKSKYINCQIIEADQVITENINYSKSNIKRLKKRKF